LEARSLRVPETMAEIRKTHVELDATDELIYKGQGTEFSAINQRDEGKIKRKGVTNLLESGA
jgi:hypothetical protein